MFDSQAMQSQSVAESGLFQFYASVSSCLGLQLPQPELNDLMHLQVSDWYGLGLELKLDPYELDIIKKDHPGNTKSQTCEMFKLWLKTLLLHTSNSSKHFVSLEMKQLPIPYATSMVSMASC